VRGGGGRERKEGERKKKGNWTREEDNLPVKEAPIWKRISPLRRPLWVSLEFFLAPQRP